MAETFNAGDIVKLKSGGPRMTVENLGRDSRSGASRVTCTWFEGGDVKSHVFPAEALERAGDDTGSMIA
jgi:uncharacterized protein YodC (DUF2158 family)